MLLPTAFRPQPASCRPDRRTRAERACSVKYCKCSRTGMNPNGGRKPSTILHAVLSQSAAIRIRRRPTSHLNHLNHRSLALPERVRLHHISSLSNKVSASPAKGSSKTIRPGLSGTACAMAHRGGLVRHGGDPWPSSICDSGKVFRLRRHAFPESRLLSGHVSARNTCGSGVGSPMLLRAFPVCGTANRACNQGSDEAVTSRCVAQYEAAHVLGGCDIHVHTEHGGRGDCHERDIARARNELGLTIDIGIEQAIARTMKSLLSACRGTVLQSVAPTGTPL
ncbi:MAG: hypothetical protein AW08_02092 [Candidatus Accumulibacter adjunctus]|uniref:Uncharacterized protein n=1 Tax=Candidatus Accumulibacter adjunctus TaxID=1454001 RepID=A0A011NRL7_9PROT|nr:MAG: hypothetical protein AW08_02092 [Candidatus Accumulibacter adjunctus]